MLSAGSVDAELLSELTSVSRADLTEWFNKDLGHPPAEAQAHAHEVIATTRKGRFELVARSIHRLHRKP